MKNNHLKRSDLQDHEPKEWGRAAKGVLILILFALCGLNWYVTHKAVMVALTVLVALFSYLFSYRTNRDRRKNS